MKRFLCFILVFVILITFTTVLPSGAFLMASADSSEPALVESQDKLYAFPANMKASVITVGQDFFTDPDQSAQDTQEEIDRIIADFESYSFDTIIIETSYKDQIYYEIDETVFTHGSPLEMLIESAISHNFFIYITFDLNTALYSHSFEELGKKIDYLSHCVHRLTAKYMIDGIILQDYYASQNNQKYTDYRDSGSGIGFENWLLENNAYLFSLVSEAIHATSNSVSVGIGIDNAWLNDSTDSRGSDTKDDFEALADGYADTRKYILDGLADFMIVYCYGGLESVELKFESIVEWWNDLAEEAQIPMFVKHANDRISSSDSRWDVSQILKQLEECANYSQYRGSILESYEQLKENDESTNALVKYYAGQINVNALYNELTMVLPKKTEFTTYEPTQIFQGTYDENFDVYFNGKPIKLNEAGNFYFEEELKVGLNVFTFKNKADTVTYRITRKVQVLKSIEPDEGLTMRVEGTARIGVNIIAYSGSKITATLSGETITLVEDETRSDDLESNTNYNHFIGYFIAPEGIVGEEQDLGIIKINGNYEDLVYESADSAHVIVNAISPRAEAAQLVKIKNDNTLAYDYYTTDNIPVPTSPRLPAGTIDTYVNTVTYNVSSEGVSQSITYYLTGSGLRLKASDCELIDGYTVVDNTAVFNGGYVQGGDTVISMHLDFQTSFNVSFSPLSYDSPTNNSYLISKFDPDYVLITFDNVSKYSGTPYFNGGLFSSGEWQTVSVDGTDKYQLKLKLAKSGVYMGYSSSYDGNGNLTIRFNGYNTSLIGTSIVIDPGHGYNKSSSNIDPGAVGQVVEQKINIMISRALTEAFQAAGATVHMLPTDTEYINLYDRSEYARRYNPDIYISIHCNSVTNGEGVRGVEAYYFTPFSQPLAALVSSRMASYYKNNVYGDGKNRDRGAKYNYFAVTLEQEFASILVECGFVTDYKEAMALNDTDTQRGLANAIVDAVGEYLARGR